MKLFDEAAHLLYIFRRSLNILIIINMISAWYFIFSKTITQLHNVPNQNQNNTCWKTVTDSTNMLKTNQLLTFNSSSLPNTYFSHPQHWPLFIHLFFQSVSFQLPTCPQENFVSFLFLFSTVRCSYSQSILGSIHSHPIIYV